MGLVRLGVGRVGVNEEKGRLVVGYVNGRIGKGWLHYGVDSLWVELMVLK